MKPLDIVVTTTAEAYSTDVPAGLEVVTKDFATPGVPGAIATLCDAANLEAGQAAEVSLAKGDHWLTVRIATIRKEEPADAAAA